MAERAYPNPSEDAKRIILKNYVKALNDPHIVSRLYSGMQAPETFEEAVKMVDRIQANLTQLTSMGLVVPQDQVEFGVTEKNKSLTEEELNRLALREAADRINRQSTELEKCKIQIRQLQEQLNRVTSRKQNYNTERNNYQARNKTGPTRHRWSEDGRPICSQCSRVGHYQRDCKDNSYKQ